MDKDSAASNLGPHLLDRKPNPPDDRDWTKDRLEYHLGAFDDSSADKTVRELRAEGLLSSWSSLLLFWRWVKAYFDKPTPPAPKPPGADWIDIHQLDQGQTGHCVGFGCAQWGNTEPVDDDYVNADGHAIYYEAKVIDGEPRAEDGSSVRSGVKALVARRRVAAYGFASPNGDVAITEIDSWLENHGPVIVGTDWYTGMFSPDAHGLVGLGGRVEGGHCYIVVGNEAPTWATQPVFRCQNSWGKSWGDGGYFYVAKQDMAKLMQQAGDACFAAELPV